ncbi:MAG TPA: HAD-IIIC family phosphatase [Allosphingosinicella sp.]|jgi:FkbH-like protein
MALPDELKAVLADRSAPLAQVMKAASAGERALGEAGEVVIGLSANVTIDLLGLFLRREALLAGLRARIVPGNYDDPVGDAGHFAEAGVEHMLLLPFFDNLLPAFEAQLESLDSAVVDAKEAELRARLRLVLERTADLKTLWIGLFHRRVPASAPDSSDRVAAIVERFNAMLCEESAGRANVRLIDVGGLVDRLGARAAYDDRFYFRSKAPYSAALLDSLARRLARSTRGFGTYFHKALALDCDNTLWGGIIGEDLLGGIKLNPFDYPGNIFWRVQQRLSGLEKSGLLLCLCTKNNPADVEEVFRSHPDMVLKESQIVARRVNWTDKVSNLVELAEELNIGLDAMIFLDDNPVEAEAVRARLPMVHMVQVPEALVDYPAVVDDIAELFLAGGVSEDSRSKTEQYRQRAAAAQEKAAFGSHEDYLASLDLAVSLRVDSPSEIGRISELSMKSNQFNLTTRRYHEAEVRALIEDPGSEIVTLTVGNKFGNAGLTGIIVLRYEGEVARVENFLMSCRVLGQGVEFAVWEEIARRASGRGCERIEADYLPTAKNGQAADFYDRLGLALQREEDGARHYAQALEDFRPPSSPWVKVDYDG